METRPRATDLSGENVVTIELPIGQLVVSGGFDLEKAVCSHGLFMMAPNKWDPQSKTLERPLRLNGDEDYDSPSVKVQVSQPVDTPNSLRLRVFDVKFLSNHQQQSLMVVSQSNAIVFFIMHFLLSSASFYATFFAQFQIYMTKNSTSEKFNPLHNNKLCRHFKCVLR